MLEKTKMLRPFTRNTILDTIYEGNEQTLLGADEGLRRNETKSRQCMTIQKRRDTQLEEQRRKPGCCHNRNVSTSETFVRTASVLRTEKEEDINELGFFDFAPRQESMDFDRDLACVSIAVQTKCDCESHCGWSKENILTQFFG